MVRHPRLLLLEGMRMRIMITASHNPQDISDEGFKNGCPGHGQQEDIEALLESEFHTRRLGMTGDLE